MHTDLTGKGLKLILLPSTKWPLSFIIHKPIYRPGVQLKQHKILLFDPYHPYRRLHGVERGEEFLVIVINKLFFILKIKKNIC